MPTRPEPRAAGFARLEAQGWADLAAAIAAMTGLEPEASEAAVVGSFDPAEDLHRRARAWGHELEHHRLDAVALFAAGLALAEAEAWTEDRRDDAMRAFVDRRHLVSDRIIHWAVPWLLAIDGPATDPSEWSDWLLEVGDRMGVAPLQGRGEGLTLPGEDGYGPLPEPGSLAPLTSLWSGAVLIGPQRLRAGSGDHRGLTDAYRAWSRRWEGLAAAHPGSGGLWRDLAARASHTAEILGGHGKA